MEGGVDKFLRTIYRLLLVGIYGTAILVIGVMGYLWISRPETWEWWRFAGVIVGSIIVAYVIHRVLAWVLQQPWD